MARITDIGGARVAKCTRLANLLLYLSARAHGATAEDIRHGVGGYAGADQTDEAFQRQFRRDRRDLARMGFPIVQTRASGEEAARFALERPLRQGGDELDAKDCALLRLCAQSALDDPAFPLKGELAQALGKLHLKAAGAKDGASRKPSERDDTGRIERLGVTLADAIRERQALSFSYAGADAPASERHIVPLRLFSYLGALYVHAFDIDKRACRKFRLGRIAAGPSPIEAGEDVLAEALSHSSDRLSVLPFQIGDGRSEAVLRLRGELADRAARLTEGSGSMERSDDGWLWRVPVADEARLAQWVAENGPGIVIIEPEGARRALVEGLRAASETEA